ncbi:MAG: hypothetical protein JW781_03625 [Deltaproteobacteria bacterium]|nr:hypothetical protein [Candidatus Anaeroferrophillacea bacterium]
MMSKGMYGSVPAGRLSSGRSGDIVHGADGTKPDQQVPDGAGGDAVPRVFIVTGAVAAGKTTLMETLAARLQRRYRLTGVLCWAGVTRPHRVGEPAAAYGFRLLPGKATLPWAARRPDGRGFDFNPDSLDRVFHHLRTARRPEVCLLDDIGPLELEGGGFDVCIRAVVAGGGWHGFAGAGSGNEAAVGKGSDGTGGAGGFGNRVNISDDGGGVSGTGRAENGGTAGNDPTWNWNDDVGSGVALGGDPLYRGTDDGPVLIMAVKKRCLDDVLRRYGIGAAAVIYDLDMGIGGVRGGGSAGCAPDGVDHEDVPADIIRHLENRDARRIAAFSVAAGLIEVGVGSILHAARVPFKGHFLALIQVLMLTAFGCRLHGRGLFQIAFISALLKSFSPAGPRLKPMFYIFTQGALFALPGAIFGWNFITALAGSLLTSVSTLFLSLGFALITYGDAYLVMMEKGINRVVGTLGWGPWPLTDFIVGFLALKAVLALAVTAAGYWGRFGFIERRLARLGALVPAREEHVDLAIAGGMVRTWRTSATGALRDMGKLRFLLPFGLTFALICGFSDLGVRQYQVILLRALLVTWLAFMLLHRVNPLSLVKFLRARGARGFAAALNYSLAAWSVRRQEGGGRGNGRPAGRPNS